MKLYRAGEPTRGVAFWSTTADQARRHSPDLAIHEAELLTAAKIHKVGPGIRRSNLALQKFKKDYDIVVFTARDGSCEYVVLNPHILRILQ